MRLVQVRRGDGTRRLAGTSTSGLIVGSLLEIVGAEAVSGAPAGTAPAGGGTTCPVVMVPMRDGVKLATEVCQPARLGKYPIILKRSRYNGHPASGLGAVSATVMKTYQVQLTRHRLPSPWPRGSPRPVVSTEPDNPFGRGSKWREVAAADTAPAQIEAEIAGSTGRIDCFV